MKIDVFNTSGKKAGKVELPNEIFAAEINESLMAQAVRVYLQNQRRGTASVKTRGEVAGSGRKIWRQKGTGRARHGDYYAPIFVGGGIAHGPKPKDWSIKMPRKMRRLALFSALTSKLKEKKVLVVQGLEKVEPKTKKMIEALTNLELKTKNHEAEQSSLHGPEPTKGLVRGSKLKEKTLLVLPEKLEKVIRAGRNIANLSLAQANLLNTYQILDCERLIFLKPSIKVLEETFAKKSKIKNQISKTQT